MMSRAIMCDVISAKICFASQYYTLYKKTVRKIAFFHLVAPPLMKYMHFCFTSLDEIVVIFTPTI